MLQQKWLFFGSGGAKKSSRKMDSSVDNNNAMDHRKVELPSETRQVVGDITPNFEENLKRAFRNEGIRLQKLQGRRGNFVHGLDDALISLGETKIELRNLKFPWIQDFRLGDITADLHMSCLDLALNLGSLRVEGEYEANHALLRRWLPVSHIGKIVITFHNVKAMGRVGLVLKEDSFVPQNYDIRYEPSEVVVRVSYHVDGENQIENEITNSNVDDTLGKIVWVQLTEILSNLLHRQLAEVVVEFSVTELLVDKDEEFRDFAKAQQSRANRLLDSVLCAAKDQVVNAVNSSTGSRKVSTPPFDVIYKGKASGMQQGLLRTLEGYASDLATLTRPQNFSLYEDKHKLTIYGDVSLREFKHGYEHYESEYEENRIDGSIKAAIYENRIFVKVTVKKEGERCFTQLEEARFTKVSDIDIDISGLASLSWLDAQLKSWVVGHLRLVVLPVLERHIKDALTHAIANTDCVALLVD